ncbi:hypothetical protein L7F22_055801 [Adiantum nelumboides]|nr:hypothetical protein [Adiantum nelumboides]
MASGEEQSNPSTSGDAGGDHNEDFGNEYGPPLPTQEELREMEHRRLVAEATNLMLNFAKDPKLAKYMTETAFQDVHAQWKATTTSPPKPDSKKQYSEKELEEEIDARLARILGAQKQGKKHDKKRKKSTDFPGYLGSQSTFDKAKKDIMPCRPNPIWAEHTNVLRVVNTSGQAGSGTRTWVCKYCGEQMTSTITRVLKNLTGIGTTGHCGGCEAVPPALRDALILGHFPPGSTASSQSGGARAAATAAEDALQDALLGDIGGSSSALPLFVGTSRKRARVSQFSSSFHPQTDGQSEIANSVVLDLLKFYISDQKTQWERYLPLVEFAYNNTIHSSTGKAPFEIVEGAMKVPPFLSTKDKIFEADEYTRDLDTAFAKVRETLHKSQERQKKAADRHRCDLKLKENDWVLLRFEKTRLRQKKGKERLFPKLSMRYYGSFQITERINDVSVRLRLPDTWKIHNAFHVSLLKPFRGDVPDDGEPDEQPEVEENEEILVPERILALRIRK